MLKWLLRAFAFSLFFIGALLAFLLYLESYYSGSSFIHLVRDRASRWEVLALIAVIVLCTTAYLSQRLSEWDKDRNSRK